jgi:hypothetical protein
MDINASMGVTLPSGDVVGLTYFMGSTNATSTSPTATTYFFLSNPGSFAVTGAVVAAAQGIFNETPAQVAFASDRESELYFTYDANNQAQPVLVPGTNFTCTIFDGNTLIGSATTVVGGSTNSGGFAECTGVYPNGSGGASANGHAYVNLPATYNSGDVYTYIISH